MYAADQLGREARDYAVQIVLEPLKLSPFRLQALCSTDPAWQKCKMRDVR